METYTLISIIISFALGFLAGEYIGRKSDEYCCDDDCPLCNYDEDRDFTGDGSEAESDVSDGDQ